MGPAKIQGEGKEIQLFEDELIMENCTQGLGISILVQILLSALEPRGLVLWQLVLIVQTLRDEKVSSSFQRTHPSLEFAIERNCPESHGCLCPF